MKLSSTFVLDAFEQADPYDEVDGVPLARAEIRKTFSGDIVGTGAVQMLSARSADGGAGYVALERITGTIGGRKGSFALLHIGTMSDGATWGRWPVVPGSGTGELAGLRGEGTIEIHGDGTHAFHLDIELPPTAG
ncbi:MAG: DUF3224 domain-containing protein [Deltaproteobacteria bacterium]|nr:DUF3224 domain-containing protein [Deltaproteobacteria bacterium]